MKLWLLALLSVFITTQGWGSVKAYFNYNSGSSYSDPYRKISRQGDNLEQVLLDQIASAKKSIYVAVQEIRLPLVALALVKKKKEGVDVRVVLEHDYNFTVQAQRDVGGDHYEASKSTDLKALVDINKDGKFSKDEMDQRDAIHILKTNGVPMLDDTSDGSSGSGLMHHKFMIIDQKSVVVSSANFTLSCIHGDILSSSTRGNANSMVVIQSATAAAIFVQEYAQLWGTGKRGNFGQRKTYRGPQTVSVSGVKLTIQFSPTSSRYNWEESVNGLIAAQFARAKQSINAALFVFSDQGLSDALEQRANAGVKMGFLVEQAFAFRDYSELLDMAGLEMPTARCGYEQNNGPWKKGITDIGVPNFASGDKLHHKFGVIDNKIVVVGSQNWSEAANYTNDETLMVIEAAGISQQYTQEYNRIKSRSRMGVPTTVKSEIERLERNCSRKGLYF